MKLPIPQSALAQHVLLLGKTRSGKSSTMRLIVEDLLDNEKPICIIDPKGDWWGLKSSATGKSAGYPVVIFGGEHADVPIDEHSGAIVAEIVATGNRPAIIDLGGWMPGPRTRFFVAFASKLFTTTKGLRWLAIDECHNFAPQGKVIDPEAGKALHWANRLASEGAGLGITLISASQRPQKVHKDYASSHETLIAKRAIHKLDRDAFRDWVDACGEPEKGKDLLRTLASMKREEGWVYSPEVDFGPVRVTFPMFKTYDSFKPQTDGRGTILKGWASVDLEDVRSKLAAVVEVAKANDPKALQSRIADLEKQITAKPAAPLIDSNLVCDVENRGFVHGLTEGYSHGWKAGWPDGVRYGAVQSAHLAASQVLNVVKTLQNTTEETIVVPDIPAPVGGPDPLKPGSSAATQCSVTAPARPKRLDNAAATKPSPARSGDGSLSGPEQRILNSVAWWHDHGFDRPTNSQVAWLAGYSPGGGAYLNPRGSLRKQELVDYEHGDTVFATAQGSRLARPPEMTGRLVNWVASRLDGPEQRIFRAVVDAYPRALSNDVLAERSGYAPSGGAYLNPRGSLRVKGLIRYIKGAEGGEVKAEDWLFT